MKDLIKLKKKELKEKQRVARELSKLSKKGLLGKKLRVFLEEADKDLGERLTLRGFEE